MSWRRRKIKCDEGYIYPSYCKKNYYGVIGPCNECSYMNNEIICDECDYNYLSGHYYNLEGKCKSCYYDSNKNCYICSENEQSPCDFCDKSYALINNNCVYCPDLFGNKCIKCSEKQCLECDYGFGLL